MKTTALVISAWLAVAGLGPASDSRPPVPSPAFKKSAQTFTGRPKRLLQ